MIKAAAASCIQSGEHQGGTKWPEENEKFIQCVLNLAVRVLGLELGLGHGFCIHRRCSHFQPLSANGLFIFHISTFFIFRSRSLHGIYGVRYTHCTVRYGHPPSINNYCEQPPQRKRVRDGECTTYVFILRSTFVDFCVESILCKIGVWLDIVSRSSIRTHLTFSDRLLFISSIVSISRHYFNIFLQMDWLQCWQLEKGCIDSARHSAPKLPINRNLFLHKKHKHCCFSFRRHCSNGDPFIYDGGHRLLCPNK